MAAAAKQTIPRYQQLAALTGPLSPLPEETRYNREVPRRCWKHPEAWRIAGLELPAMSTIPLPNPSGLCLCGCGGITPIARRDNRHHGHVKGQHCRCMPGHKDALVQESSHLRERECAFCGGAVHFLHRREHRPHLLLTKVLRPCV